MDVRNETGLSLPFVVMHEGTGERPVSLTVSGVQEPDLIYPAILNSPEDQWSRTVNESGPFTLSGKVPKTTQCISIGFGRYFCST